MKKYIAIFLCLVLCVCSVGCKKPATNNEEAKTALLKVLNKEADFTFKSLVNESTSQENLTKFTFSTVYSALNRFSPMRYMFVNFDADGVEELLIAGSDFVFCLMLRYDGGTVYGNIIEYISYDYVSTDGSFLTKSLEGTRRQICKVSFDGPNCNLETLAYINENTKTYQVDYQDVSKADAEAYFEKWDKETEKLTWEKIGQ